MAEKEAQTAAEHDQPDPASEPANQRYYLTVGQGDWDGRFTFRLTDRQAFRRSPAGPTDRFLALWLVITFRLLGWCPITSSLRRRDDAVPVRVDNRVRIHRFGLDLYVLAETYTLDPDGTSVVVDALERFGPVPFLFRRRKRHTARVLDGGMRAVYTFPLLGTEWTGVYRVHDDCRHIDSTMTTTWAEAHEHITKL